eukprot:gene15238-18035_t
MATATDQHIRSLLGHKYVSIGWLSAVTKLDKETNRLAYSFIDAILIIFCAVCYLVYIIFHKFKKQYVYQDETILDKQGNKRRKRRSKPWTKRLSKIFCYYTLIDMDEDDQKFQLANELPHVEYRQSVEFTNPNGDQIPPPAAVIIAGSSSGSGSTPPGTPPLSSSREAPRTISYIDARIQAAVVAAAQEEGIELNTFRNDSQVPDDQVRTSVEFFKQSKLASPTGGDVSSRSVNTGKLKVSPSIIGELMPKHELSFRNYLCVVVYQLFVIGTWFWLHNLTTLIIDKNLFSTPFLALVAIVVFHVSRLILMGISNGLNRLLKPKEIRYFTYFQFPLIYWFFRHRWLVSYLDSRSQNSAVFRFLRKALEDENPSYDQHVRDLSVEYYYDKMAEYISVVTMVVFLSLIRSLSYKSSSYPKFHGLSQHDFLQLLWRYLYLLCFEVSYDLIIRLLARRMMKIDISNRGRNETISNFTTRFIFSLFVLYDLMDVYNSQSVYRDI